MSTRQRVSRLVRRTPVLRTVHTRLRGRAAPVVRVEEAPAPRVVRTDPLPERRPFPDVQHIVLVGAIPADYGGRTSSILTKCRTLYELGGVRSLILTVSHSPHLPEAVEAMRRRGHLGEGVEVGRLLDHFPDATRSPARPDGPVPHDPEVPGTTRVASRDGRTIDHYDERGLHRLRRQLDRAGRLLLQDAYSDARVRVSRQEYDPEDGRLVRETFWGETSPDRRQDVYYRRNGRPLFAHHTSSPDKPGGYLKDDRVVFFDEDGAVEEQVSGTFSPVVHRCLDAVVGDRPTILSVEARFADRMVLGYDRPSVRAVYVLHSSHLRPPGDDVDKLRPSFQLLLGHADELPALVFLTDSQRADAEEHLGRHEAFRVVPHTSAPPRLDPSIERDPDLVVMLGRLAPEKQMRQAVKAFRSVVRERPTARLEIYGEGPERADLVNRIRAAGLEDHVVLKGFTDDPGGVYQRASACLLTSRFEGAPLVLVEALRHGCPVISYDIRYGPADIIEDGVNGFLVPAGDTAALADRITEVLADPALRDRLSRGGLAAEERFGPEAFTARWSEVFHRLADTMPTAPPQPEPPSGTTAPDPSPSAQDIPSDPSPPEEAPA